MPEINRSRLPVALNAVLEERSAQPRTIVGFVSLLGFCIKVLKAGNWLPSSLKRCGFSAEEQSLVSFYVEFPDDHKV